MWNVLKEFETIERLLEDGSLNPAHPSHPSHPRHGEHLAATASATTDTATVATPPVVANEGASVAAPPAK